MKGYRRTEELADEFCAKLRAEHEGRGLAVARFRLLVIEELDRFLTENQLEPEIGAEFDRDWASGLLYAALRALEARDPTAHLLFLRAYDRPEGVPPWTGDQLARRLQVDRAEVDEALERGRHELETLFRTEIERTVCDPDCVSVEVAHLRPFARAMFEGTSDDPGLDAAQAG